MFAGGSSKGGFIEAQQTTVTIENISYAIFTQLMSYLYTGTFSLCPSIQNCLKAHQQALTLQSEAGSSRTVKLDLSNLTTAVDYLIDLLRVADEYLLEEVKNHC